MKKKMRNLTLAMFLGALAASAARAADVTTTETQETIANFVKADPALQAFVTNSAGYVVFPTIGKGGLVVGGAHGTGLVYEKGKVIGEAKMTQASIGAQAGGQTFSEIIFFETPHALEDFKSGNFEMGADLSAVIAAEGVSKTARYKNGIAVFTVPKKGAMVQASVGGQKFKYTPLK